MGPLSDPDVIEILRQNYIPLALDLYTVRVDTGPTGRLFKTLQKKQLQYQGIWIASPDLEILGANSTALTGRAWVIQIRELLESSSERWNKLKPSFVPKPSKYATPTIADAFARKDQTPNSGPLIYIDARQTHMGSPDGPVMIDAINLPNSTFIEFSSSPTIGAKFPISPEISRRFIRALSPMSDPSTLPKDSELKIAELVATVAEVSPNEVTLDLDGQYQADYAMEGDVSRPAQAVAKAVGSAKVKLPSGELDKMVIIFDGRLRRLFSSSAPEVEFTAAAETAVRDNR